jgi:hypothetical protein
MGGPLGRLDACLKASFIRRSKTSTSALGGVASDTTNDSTAAWSPLLNAA